MYGFANEINEGLFSSNINIVKLYDMFLLKLKVTITNVSNF